MAKDKKAIDTAERQPKSGPVPISGVMLSARAIIAQGRTLEFIEECESKGHYMRATLAFLRFVEEFRDRPLRSEGKELTAAPKAGSVKMTAEATKFTTAARKCDNTFKKK